MAGPNDLGEIFSVEKKCLILSAERLCSERKTWMDGDNCTTAVMSV